ncbi:MAG: ATP synthase F1 subunit epsilon [Bdellovibrionota bacterium]
MKMNLLTPERKLVYQQEIEEVIVPAFKGELNILPGHAPLVTTLTTGILRWRLKGSDVFEKAVVSGGYCEVFPSGVSILADSADLANEVDQSQAEKELQAVDQTLGTVSLNDEEWEKAQREAARLRADLELIGVKPH